MIYCSSILGIALLCASVIQAAAVASFELNYTAEIDFLIQNSPRLIGSPAHNALLTRIETALVCMGLPVQADNYTFEYMTPPSTPPSLICQGKQIEIASVFPYSGLTESSGVNGELIDVGFPAMDWHLAEGKIAVLSLSNPTVQYSTLFQMWDASKNWKGELRNPLISTDKLGTSLLRAKEVGVKAVIFAWDETITTDNAQNQYLPFKFPFIGCPAVFTSGKNSRDILEAANSNRSATLTLASQLKKNTSTRTLYVVVPGTNATKSHESVLIITHTDGTNVIEENGHIGMLQLVHDTVQDSPQRTHIFVFTSGHLRIPAFTKSGKATTRWLNDHPEFWRGGSGQYHAVVGLSIEHLGAIEFAEDLKRQSYSSTGKLQPEILYAGTRELATLVEKECKGVDPSFVGVLNPSGVTQFGEGAALSEKEIPNISLGTGPLYLLAQWEGDQHDLVDIRALVKQVQSLRRLRTSLDKMEAASFGTLYYREDEIDKSTLE